MADTCQNPLIQVRFSLIFPLILIRFALDLKQIPPKNERNMFIIWVKDLVIKLLTSNFWLPVDYFLTWSWFVKLHMIGLSLSFFLGICFKTHANLTSITGNIKESLTWIDGVFNGFCHCCCFEVMWFSAVLNKTEFTQENRPPKPQTALYTHLQHF